MTTKEGGKKGRETTVVVAAHAEATLRPSNQLHRRHIAEEMLKLTPSGFKQSFEGHSNISMIVIHSYRK
jgi:hypothetical protein